MIHEISPNLFVIPGSVFSYREKESKFLGILSLVTKNFSNVLIVQDRHFTQKRNELNIVWDKNGSFRSLESSLSKSS